MLIYYLVSRVILQSLGTIVLLPASFLLCLKLKLNFGLVFYCFALFLRCLAKEVGPRPSVVGVVIHTIALSKVVLINEGVQLVRGEQWFGSAVGPVDRQSWTGNLHEEIHLDRSQQLDIDLRCYQYHVIKDTFNFFDQPIQYTSIALPAKSSENEANPFCLSFQSTAKLLFPTCYHCLSRILLLSQIPTVRVVLVELELWVRDHSCLHVEPPIAKENYNISMVGLHRQSWRCASEYLSRRPGLFLRNNDILEPFLGQSIFSQEKRVIELNGPQDVDCLLCQFLEVVDNCLDEVLDIDLYFYEDVKDSPFRLRYRDQTRMPVVHKQITVHLFASQVVDAAGSISDVGHYDCLNLHGGKLPEDVADHTCEEHESFWKLEGYFQSWFIDFFGEDFDAVEGLIDFKVVVRRQYGDGICEQFVVSKVLGYACDQSLLWLLHWRLFVCDDGQLSLFIVICCFRCLLHQLYQILILMIMLCNPVVIWQKGTRHSADLSLLLEQRSTYKFKIFLNMGNQVNRHEQNKNNRNEQAKKKPVPPPPRVGRKKKGKGIDAAAKLPGVTPITKCRLRQLKLERIKDYLLMEEEFIEHYQKKEQTKPEEENEEFKKIEQLRGLPMNVGTLEEFIDEDHCIVSSTMGPEYYVPIMSFVDKDQLEPNSSVLLNHRGMSIVGIMQDDVDPLLNVMKVQKAPLQSYADIGGLENQIQEIKEAVELPLTHPEVYQDMGIKPPKGVILYGEPGTGKTLLAKAVANETSATFLRVVGSELIQKYLGDGPKLVRELFKTAQEHSPAIIFIDQIDAIGTKRYDSNSGGEKEVQRTMLELLNQLDGFDTHAEVKVIMATNKIESLDPALIRPGRIDRKIEFPVPDLKTKHKIFQIHTSKMNLNDDVSAVDLIQTKDDLSGADIKAMCTEAGLIALRERRMKVTKEDFDKAKEKVLYLKKGDIPEGLYI